MSSRCLYPAAPWMPPLDVHQAQTINTSNPTQHLPKPTPPLVSLPQCWHHHPARLLGQKSAHHPGPPPASPQPCPIWPSGLPQLTNYLLCFAPTFFQASIISSSESPPHSVGLSSSHSTMNTEWPFSNAKLTSLVFCSKPSKAIPTFRKASSLQAFRASWSHHWAPL